VGEVARSPRSGGRGHGRQRGTVVAWAGRPGDPTDPPRSARPGTHAGAGVWTGPDDALRRGLASRRGRPCGQGAAVDGAEHAVWHRDVWALPAARVLPLRRRPGPAAEPARTPPHDPG